MDQDLFEKYFNQTLRFLSFRSRSEKEIRDYLAKKKDITAEVIEKIVARLLELDFINDVKFTEWWIEQRMGRKPRGSRVIAMELKMKGIKQDLIDEKLHTKAIDALSKEAAKKAAEKKAALYEKLPIQEFRQKLSQFLLRRGFSWDDVRDIVDELVKKG